MRTTCPVETVVQAVYADHVHLLRSVSVFPSLNHLIV